MKSQKYKNSYLKKTNKTMDNFINFHKNQVLEMANKYGVTVEELKDLSKD